LKTAEQIIKDTLAAENHDERYLHGRFHDVRRDKEILTCEDIPERKTCCDTCHTFYIVYEMHLVETYKGLAWICCAVKRELFPRDPNKPVSREENPTNQELWDSVRGRTQPGVETIVNDF
jgi:hypothetical protein